MSTILDSRDHRQACEDYLLARTGKYEWRMVRYGAVADKLVRMGLTDDDIVVDVGAGWCEFDHYLRTEVGWCGRYLPIDGNLDGTDLNVWSPKFEYGFLVAIELLEHLRDPCRLMFEMVEHATKGVAATTPNPETTDVFGMDPTHICSIHADVFTVCGWDTRIESFYGQPEDSILAWRSV